MRREVQRLPCAGRCPHPHSHRAAIGLTADNRFRAAPLKEYPPLLCRSMALAIATARNRHVPAYGDDVELPLAWKEIWQPLDPYFEYEMGADFARPR